MTKKQVKQFLIKSGIPNPDKSMFWLEVVTEKGHDEKEIRRVIDVLKCAEQNPTSRKAFEMLTGHTLPKTQKDSQTFLEKFCNLEANPKRWLTETEVKNLVEKYKGKKVVIDDNKSDWRVGRKVHTSNPRLNKLIGIEDDSTLVYSRDTYEFSRPISAIRDFVIDGKSQIGDKQNEDYSKDLFN